MSRQLNGPDLLTGNLWKKIILFTIPLMLSNILQLLYNAADIAVVGHFAGGNSLGAVGACGAITNLLTALFIGLSVGANVAVAQGIGKGDSREVSDTVHTSVAFGLVCGVFLAAVGLILAPTFLAWMGTPGELLPLSTVYMRIIFAGMPASILYNFGSAVLRAKGETRGPLRILIISGVLNVGLNLVFVICFQMNVAGVALATVISQVLSAALVLLLLIRAEDATRLTLSRVRFHRGPTARIIKVGIPAGLQSATFSASNVIIQSTVNVFGPATVSGATAAANIDGFQYTAMNALHHTAVTFAGQHYGAKKYKRIGLVALECAVTVTVIGLVIGWFITTFGQQLLTFIYGTTEEQAAAGMQRLLTLCPTYFLCGLLDVVTGMQRGMGSSVRPMIASIIGVCVFRVVWIYGVYPMYRTLRCVYLSYPISYVLTLLVQIPFFLLLWTRAMKRKETTEDV